MNRGERKLTALADAWAAQHREELVSDLKQLIAIPSVVCYGQDGLPMGPACKQALDAFSAMAQRYGLPAQNHNDHCVSVTLAGRCESRELGLLCHLDVVPAGDGWRFDPWQATEQNGWLIGRGSCDNKGPSVMALFVLRCLRDLGVPLKSSVRLIAGCDEERDMRDGSHYLANHPAPDFTLNCDGAWSFCMGEKGNITCTLVMDWPEGNLLAIQGGTALNAAPDAASATIRHLDAPISATGRAAHCATPDRGDNAIVKLMNQLCAEAGNLLTAEENSRMKRLCKCFLDNDGTGLRIAYADAVSGRTTCVPCRIQMENNQLLLTLAIRHAITQDADALLRNLRHRCEALGFAVRDVQRHPPRYTPPDTPEVKQLAEVCRLYAGREHRPYVMGGGSHSRLFPRSLPFGPFPQRMKNPFGGPHEADEAVCVKQLLDAIKVYVAALARLDY